ncbi:SEC-C metal-binding domain-containing protein [Aquibacillus koreensis]|uniref:SEC-C metal-binding domain-containing protein n=1 Tax=Aquibacillus koreensis TaxID=279446 RepID=A0A9X4AK38_9BACI|nr:SEC-C metal-binding domain-containing protein [Aquibacillus koreensis]MCT2535512.1 SEC-C metal-binding domain-containing protein [Aquibacillus koreensis]MDC3422872.1 SEC-C metal-binding domain-containing protein [Aquibacillus koreensis]
MSNQLEKNMLKALTGLNDLSRKEKEKREQKRWATLNVPFSLDEVLSKYTKHELDTIRKKLDIKNASSLKKADLAALLVERIPAYLTDIQHLWDNERFQLLRNIANNGGQMPTPNLEAKQMEYFKNTGLIFTGTSDNEKILALPDELVESVLSMKNDLNVRARISRNTEWITLTYGLLYYYGTLNSNQMIDLLEKYTKEPIDYRDYTRVISDANDYRKEIKIDMDGFSNIRVVDPKEVKKEHRMRKNVDFYPFTKQQLLAAGEPGFVDRNKSYQQVVSFFTANFEMSRDEADHTVEEIVYATRIGHGPNEVMTYLSNIIEFDDMDTIQSIMDQVVVLMNNTKQWFLKGYAPLELGEKKKEDSPPPPEATKPSSKKVVKIGRNEPCPCGSGKKYKKCCGR